jgi:hypothetical protein
MTRRRELRALYSALFREQRVAPREGEPAPAVREFLDLVRDLADLDDPAGENAMLAPVLNGDWDGLVELLWRVARAAAAPLAPPAPSAPPAPPADTAPPVRRTRRRL